ncbi:MAG: methylenetetrahydrofolate--tRNA-(uracil(54)-C(5))-methyltransferase (FADH(2)-oxidizing) TrmFO [Oscillospiraceae bacterium]|jgi:methylenetetrahydrofolate--tRNA-(uracil-5-)-methyltransferase|nr:methylenetetrahydrofolate--tRNA-(uracil(54)-C(5))-methyltransferase (FADH(2)-oxidizing) TrmFO [Oscillospiraceae bacterium]
MIHIIGGGLAGVEAAWQLARAGIPCVLSEMKPARFSPAHTNADLAELVCSNSLKAERLGSAAGLLKEEMRRLGSLSLAVAQDCRVPAGGALAVDRDRFSRGITAAIASEPLIRLRREEIAKLPCEGPVIVAAGPLCSDALSADIQRFCGGGLHFYDAAAPIVTAESVDRTHCFAASRYGNGGEEDYLNCPLNREEYEAFEAALVSAERARLHDFDVYEGCMPIEVLAARGRDAIRFGPMKPVGLRDPATGRRPWAVLQLRRENAGGTLLNLVGFQTNLTFGEQRRVFGMIPALRAAEFVRFGVMHRNTFLDSPRLLGPDYQARSRPGLWFAGQITGVEGYMESAGSGILAGRNAARALRGQPPLVLPAATMLGALSRYISDPGVKRFEPMGASFGLLPPLDEKIRDKRERYERLAARALTALDAATG